ncbi:MAG: hypothetical protein WBG57_12325, partial [Ornithinimicrobium sp.]
TPQEATTAICESTGAVAVLVRSEAAEVTGPCERSPDSVLVMNARNGADLVAVIYRPSSTSTAS